MSTIDLHFPTCPAVRKDLTASLMEIPGVSAVEPLGGDRFRVLYEEDQPAQSAEARDIHGAPIGTATCTLRIMEIAGAASDDPRQHRYNHEAVDVPQKTDREVEGTRRGGMPAAVYTDRLADDKLVFQGKAGRRYEESRESLCLKPQEWEMLKYYVALAAGGRRPPKPDIGAWDKTKSTLNRRLSEHWSINRKVVGKDAIRLKVDPSHDAMQDLLDSPNCDVMPDPENFADPQAESEDEMNDRIDRERLSRQ